MNCLPCSCLTLLILVVLGCFDSYKIDYSAGFARVILSGATSRKKRKAPGLRLVNLMGFGVIVAYTDIRRWQTFTPPQRPAHAAHCGLVLHRRAYRTPSRNRQRDRFGLGVLPQTQVWGDRNLPLVGIWSRRRGLEDHKRRLVLPSANRQRFLHLDDLGRCTCAPA